MSAPVAPPKLAAKRVRITIHGADTPRGRELATLLRLHPAVESAREIASDGAVLVGWDAALEPKWRDSSGRFLNADVVFVSLPPDRAQTVIMDALEAGARVIDLSRSLRSEGFGLGIPADAGEGETAYGLPELSAEDVADAEHVANAGSLATCATLALAPAAMAGHLGRRVELEATVGMTKTSPQVQPTRAEARDEIQENIRELHRCLREPHVKLDRQVDPRAHGVYTATVLDGDDLTSERVQTLYETFYADAPCVNVLPQGMPALPSVHGTNKVQIGVRETQDGDVEIACALDDTIKGSVGQAIQNMNLMCGFPETLGLPEFGFEPPTRPVDRATRRPDL